MVSGLDSGSRDLVLRPGQVLLLCSWVGRSTFTVPLSILGYNKWGTRKFSGKPDEKALFTYRIYGIFRDSSAVFVRGRRLFKI